MENLLEHLISSLTQREKAFINKNLNSKSDLLTNSSFLYEHILKNGKINKYLLVKQLGNKNIVKNLTKEKEKLIEKILLCLLNFHKNSNSHKIITKYILFIKTLIERDIFSNIEKYIKKAKNLAYKYEEFNLILNIIEIEESLCFTNCFIINYNKLKELQDEREKIYKIIKNLNYLLTLKAELQQYQFNEESYNFDLNNFIKNYGHSPLINEDEILSVKAKSVSFYIKGIISFIQHDYHSSVELQSKHYSLFNDHPYLFPRKEYLQLISNFLYSCSLIKNECLFNNLMKEFLNIKDASKEELEFITKRKYHRTLTLYHQLERYKDGERLAIEAENYIENNRLIFSNIENIELHFNIMRAFIDSMNYTKAIQCTQKQFRNIGLKLNSSMFKLFEFIAHYKLGNFENLIYSVNSWTKTISSKRKQFPIEKVLIRFFRLVINKTTCEEKKQLIINTINQLKDFEKSEQKYYIDHFFNFTVWFERELDEMK